LDASMLIRESGMARFQSGLAALQAWRSSRLQGSRFLPLAMMLAWAAWVASDRTYGQSLAMLGLAYTLIAQFRLWDDLVDRDRDRSLHPGRVLASAEDATLLRLTGWGLGAVNAIALYALNGGAALVGLMVLHGVLGIWYARRASRDLLHDHALLLKYPVFVVLLASPTSNPSTLVLMSLLVYAAMCAFELLDRDARGRRQRSLLALHCAVLTVGAFGANAPGVSWALAGIVAVVLAIVWLRHYGGRPLRGGMYLPFVIVAIILFQLSWGA